MKLLEPPPRLENGTPSKPKQVLVKEEAEVEPGVSTVEVIPVLETAAPQDPPEAMTLQAAADGQAMDLGEIVVEARNARSLARMASVSDLAIQPVMKLAGKELQRRALGTLGETLAGMPGVTSNYFSPGASRPVIRGFEGYRVRMMRDGLSTMDLSDTSPDHGVAVEPILAEEIEVHRGPASLLYGNGAIGGAVNVKTRSYARERPPHAITGGVDSRYETASEGWAESGWVAVQGGPFVLQLTGSIRESEDIRIPQTARTPESDLLSNPRTRDPRTGVLSNVPNPSGRLPNSFHQAESYSIGLSLLPEDSPLWSAFSFSNHESRYGLPYSFDGDINSFFGDAVIDFTQERYDWEAGYDFDEGIIESIQVKVANSQFAQDEQIIGRQKDQGRFISDTLLSKDVTEGRLSIYHSGFGDRLDGVVGVHAFTEKFSASRLLVISPERRVASYFDTTNLGVYALEKLTVGDFRFQLGGRWEEQTILNRTLVTRPAVGLSKSAYSLAAAATWEKRDWLTMDRFALTAIYSRTQRIPTSIERYAFWNSAALGRYLVGGDVDGQELDLEQSTGVEFNLDAKWKRGAVHLSGFHYDYDNFIFLQELPRGVTLQRSATYIERAATFFGWEAEIEAHLLKRDQQRVTLKFLGDYVRGYNEKDREFIPRMPPMHLGGRLECEFGRFSGGLELRHALEQTRVKTGFRSESGTDPYTLINADFAWQIMRGDRYELSMTLQATNLLDADARQSTSFRKEVAPMPGRGFSIGMQLRF